MALMKRHNLACAAAVALCAVIAALPAAAQDKPVQLKLSHWVPPQHPLQKSMEEWLASVSKDSNGTITGQVYPAQQLGKAFDHYDMARDGIADITYINPGYQPGRFPVIAAGELPFTFADAKNGTKAFDEWYRKYAAREMKDVKFCLGFIHDPGALHSRKKVVVPADIKGMKIRPAQATIAEFVTLLGGANVQASAPESRDVLERGVADAITFPWGSVLLFGIEKAVKYHMDVPLYSTTFAWVMNKDKYDSMSPAQKKVIDNHCNTEWAEKVAAPWADFEAAGRGKIKAMPDHEVYALTPDQVNQWKKAAEPLHATWAKNVAKAGLDAKKVYGELQAELAKYHAAY
jgi:TRAP-type C4-dicarboxylate transport system substrate-binding protein